MHYGLEGEALHEVIAAENKMFDCKNEYPGALAIVLCNSARVSAAVFRETNEVLANAPEKIGKAVDKINQVARENQRFVENTEQELAIAAERLRRAADEIREQQTAIKKGMDGWTRDKLFWLRVTGGCCVLAVVTAALAVYGVFATQRSTQQAVADFKQEAIALTAKATAVNELQKVIVARGNLNALIKRWESESDAFKAQNTNPNELTEEQAAVKAGLDERAAALMERRHALEEKEKREGWTLKK